MEDKEGGYDGTYNRINKMAYDARKGQFMKHNIFKKLLRTAAAILVSTALLAGCGQQEESRDTAGAGQRISEAAESAAVAAEPDPGEQPDTDRDPGEQPDADTDLRQGTEKGGEQEPAGAELEVRFGDSGEPFRMQMEDNETAAAIARYVGTSDWRLPIYERDDNADYDVMQYYDIPGRYEIPSDPETVTEEKAGEVYYSDPNRIVLFYHDAEITGEYTKIGTFDATEEFVNAVEENPVLEGWGNKIVQIARP